MLNKIYTNSLTNENEKGTLKKMLPEIRCPQCGRLLAMGRILMGSVEIQCRNNKCKALILVNQYGFFKI